MAPSERPNNIYLSRIFQLQEKPQPYKRRDPQFWTDKHIAKLMLATHLDPTVDGLAGASKPSDVSQTGSRQP